MTLSAVMTPGQPSAQMIWKFGNRARPHRRALGFAGAGLPVPYDPERVLFKAACKASSANPSELTDQDSKTLGVPDTTQTPRSQLAVNAHPKLALPQMAQIVEKVVELRCGRGEENPQRPAAELSAGWAWHRRLAGELPDFQFAGERWMPSQLTPTAPHPPSCQPMHGPSVPRVLDPGNYMGLTTPTPNSLTRRLNITFKILLLCSHRDADAFDSKCQEKPRYGTTMTRLSLRFVGRNRNAIAAAELVSLCGRC
jgi:hypothetical protein